MGYTAYLQRGKYKFYLNAAPYTLHERFMPPAISEVANISEGTSANQYGGSALIDKRAVSASYTFTVRINSTTSGAIDTFVNRLDTFIRSGTEADPVYFCWKPDSSISFEPLWGQWGATRRCKVVNGNAYLSGTFYGTSELRSKRAYADVTLLINPPEGVQQIAAQAKGFIYEDIIGAVAGTSRGLRVMDAATNKITNPVFGHGTWNNDWTAAANVIEERNTDKQFILWGSSSAKLHAYGAAGNGYTMLIDVNNTNQHCLQAWVKKEDGSAVTATDVVLYYGDQQTTTYYSLGDGWYMLWCLVTGVDANTATGIYVKSKYSVYLAGVQLIEKSYPRPMIYGDELGCSWASTAHDSTSASAVAYFRLPMANTINRGGGTIRFVWRAPCASTAYGTNNRFFETDTSLFRFLWDSSNNYYIFNDGTNSINSSATTFAANDEIVFHLTWGPTGLVVYRNGTAIAAGATYTAPTTGTYLYIGSAADATLHSNGMYFDFQTWARPMSGTEVAADYANVAPLVAADLNISRMPYFWTKDGDSVLDNCDDSTRDNWGVVGGVPGSLPAITRWYLTPSDYTDTAWWLGQVVLGNRGAIYPTTQWYLEGSGTNTAATDSGSAVQTESVDSSAWTGLIDNYVVKDAEYMVGEINYFIRLASTTGNLTIRTALGYGLTGFVYGDVTPLTTDATRRLYYLGSLNVEPNKLYSAEKSISYGVQGKRTTGTADVLSDFIMAISGPVIRIGDELGSGSIMLEDNYAYGIDANGVATSQLFTRGKPILVHPGLNMIFAIMGDSGAAHVVAHTLTFSAIYITPRWALA